MNDKQKEQAARRLCELRGIDPDEKVQHGADPDKNGFVVSILLCSPAWERALREIEDHVRMHEAINYAIWAEGDRHDDGA